MDPDPDEEDIEDLVLNDDREIRWRMVLRTTMEGWMVRRPFYILISMMSKIHRRRRF